PPPGASPCARTEGTPPDTRPPPGSGTPAHSAPSTGTAPRSRGADTAPPPTGRRSGRHPNWTAAAGASPESSARARHADAGNRRCKQHKPTPRPHAPDPAPTRRLPGGPDSQIRHTLPLPRTRPGGLPARMPRPIIILPDPPPPPTAIGLIAGGGRLPIRIAEGLREAGHKVCGLGLARQYDDDLPPLCDSFREVGLLRVGSWGQALRRQNVRHAIMVGRVDKARLMHDPFRILRNIPDTRTAIAWYKRLRHDRRSHAVL